MSPPAPVERPPHVHPTRMRHIADDDLAAGVGLPGASPAAVRAHLAARPDRHPTPDHRQWAEQARGTAAADEILETAKELLTREVDFVSPAAGRSGLYGLHYLTWMTPLVQAYELSGDDAYPAAFGRIFRAWYASRDVVVGDWPGLDVVWYSLGVWARAMVLVPAMTTFAETPALDDATFADMLRTVLGGARWAAEEHDEFRHGNWQLVCAAELLHVAAFLPDAEEAPQWARVGRERTLEHLDRDFYPDGGHHERSPGYHVLCLQALRRAEEVAGRHLGWRPSDHPAFGAAHDWLAAMRTPAGWVPAWQDSPVVYPDIELPEPKPGSKLLPSSGYAILAGQPPANPFMIVNVGPYVEHELESHSHLAVTDFVLVAFDAPLAIEAGGPPTYDDPLYQSWYRSPAAHNVVTLPDEQMTTDRRCELDEFTVTEHVTVLRAHHHGYSRRVERRILFVAGDPAYWLISDTVDGGGPATWSIHGPAQWRSVDGGFASTGGPALHVVPAHRALLAARTEVGVGQLPRGKPREFGPLHALRLDSPVGRFDVLLTATSTESVAPPRLSSCDGGWRITCGSFIDSVDRGRWERRGADGQVVATARWEQR
ncbi:heparinase II/III family protein [Labedaea rhizosphaerae]|uniref:Heparinase II/III-like protein n=1 Tax=Labedaea rhizosphaerae TaxID=598644 RepID=A0A4R6S560_LABRH|nr:heparinase II/III family protein [Labedaea rhizosphaerae]TDP94840.1 heparinase II/III-like protein [Labedaea rhizosphaerae]